MLTARFGFLVALLGAAVLLSPGSVGAAEDLGTVEGVITLDGKPLASGKVFFHLPGGQFVGARTKEDGTYRVNHVPAGRHKVTVEFVRDGRNLLPPRYSSEEQSALVVELKAGKNTIDLNLASR